MISIFRNSDFLAVASLANLISHSFCSFPKSSHDSLCWSMTLKSQIKVCNFGANSEAVAISGVCLYTQWDKFNISNLGNSRKLIGLLFEVKQPISILLRVVRWSARSNWNMSRRQWKGFQCIFPKAKRSSALGSFKRFWRASGVSPKSWMVRLVILQVRSTS